MCVCVCADPHLSLSLLQKEGACKNWSNHFPRGGIIGDEMGLGKTLTAITTSIVQRRVGKFSDEELEKLLPGDENKEKRIGKHTTMLVVPKNLTDQVSLPQTPCQGESLFCDSLSLSLLCVCVVEERAREARRRRQGRHVCDGPRQRQPSGRFRERRLHHHHLHPRARRSQDPRLRWHGQEGLPLQHLVVEDHLR